MSSNFTTRNQPVMFRLAPWNTKLAHSPPELAPTLNTSVTLPSLTGHCAPGTLALALLPRHFTWGGWGTSAVPCASTQWFFALISPSPAPSASDLTQITTLRPPRLPLRTPFLLSFSPRVPGDVLSLSLSISGHSHRRPRPRIRPLASTTCPADSLSETRFPRQAPGKGGQRQTKVPERAKGRRAPGAGGPREEGPRCRQDAGSEGQGRRLPRSVPRLFLPVSFPLSPQPLRYFWLPGAGGCQADPAPTVPTPRSSVMRGAGTKGAHAVGGHQGHNPAPLTPPPPNLHDPLPKTSSR